MKRQFTGAAVAVALAVPAVATATPTIRVEGATSNTVPLTPVPRASSVVSVDDVTDTDALNVPGRSATAQLSRATLLYGLPLGFDIFNFGGPSSFVTRIGADAMPPSFSPSWRLKVNHAASDTGSDTTTLGKNDSVLWSYESDFTAPELDLTVSRDTVAGGGLITATVLSYDNAGKATPAAGAVVRYAGRNYTAPPTGVVSLTATQSGPGYVSASLAGATRSPRRLICVAGPTLPCSAVTFPKSGSTGAAPRMIGGVVARVGGKRPTVAVSIARQVSGGKCRFVTRTLTRLTPPRPCDARVTLPATVDPSGAWTLTFPDSTAAYGTTSGFRLPAGSYVVSSRATFRGVTERSARARFNTAQFTVAP